MDTIIGIVAVIGLILMQVLAKKKNGESTGTPPPEPPSGSDPQDELRKFFEEMEKTLKPEPPKPVFIPSAPPPPPPPPRAKSRPKREPNTARVHNSRSEPTTLSERPFQSAKEAAQAFMKTVSRAATIPRIPVPAIHSAYINSNELRDPMALRKMIVTMEVIGKPVSLRTS